MIPVLLTMALSQAAARPSHDDVLIAVCWPSQQGEPVIVPLVGEADDPRWHDALGFEPEPFETTVQPAHDRTVVTALGNCAEPERLYSLYPLRSGGPPRGWHTSTVIRQRRVQFLPDEYTIESQRVISLEYEGIAALTIGGGAAGRGGRYAPSALRWYQFGDAEAATTIAVARVRARGSTGYLTVVFPAAGPEIDVHWRTVETWTC